MRDLRILDLKEGNSMRVELRAKSGRYVLGYVRPVQGGFHWGYRDEHLGPRPWLPAKYNHADTFLAAVEALGNALADL